jgi:hypothetical protein
LRCQAAQVSRPLRCRLPRCRAIDVASLAASVASLDVMPSPPSASTPPTVPPSSSLTPVAIPDLVAPSLTPLRQPITDPSFGLDAASSGPVVVPDPRRRPQPCLPRYCAIDAASLNASTTSLNATSSRQPQLQRLVLCLLLPSRLSTLKVMLLKLLTTSDSCPC